MNNIRVGLTGSDLLSLKHPYVEVSAKEECSILSGASVASIAPNTTIHISAIDNHLKVEGLKDFTQTFSSITIRSHSANSHLLVKLPKSSTAKAYTGALIVIANENVVQVIIQCPLEEYVCGVLHSEIPANYHIEAIKAQAIAARTYGLNPRIDHHLDNCQVCDSYLCCQCFTGELTNKNERLQSAVDQTTGQIISYKDKPILALFSSCAGGHTENYESCFSDPLDNVFPPPAIPYLRGISENLHQKFTVNEKTLESMWHSNNNETVDAWSPHFKWSQKLSADMIEANMHHTIEAMLNQKNVAPFVIPPKSELFGTIESFSIDKRGIGGTGIIMTIATSKGIWGFQKELVIRSVFKNSAVNLSRLKSARIYFEHIKNNQGQLKELSIYGLGWGHGVGLQQTGAQGLAHLYNQNCQKILEHYFTDIEIVKI